MLNQQKQEMARSEPDPFPREGVGSGDETNPNLGEAIPVPSQAHLYETLIVILHAV